MDIRNCQQAMRGEQNMRSLSVGDSFTREDLERFMKFPTPPDGFVYEAGDVITPESADPATNGDHIWLKVTGPGIEGYVGKNGFDSLDDITGW